MFSYLSEEPTKQTIKLELLCDAKANGGQHAAAERKEKELIMANRQQQWSGCNMEASGVPGSKKR